MVCVCWNGAFSVIKTFIYMYMCLCVALNLERHKWLWNSCIGLVRLRTTRESWKHKMGYWKSKVLPKIKKVFEMNNTKKTAAAEASKSFDESKEEYNKVFEEKKTELQTKVLEVYESSSTEIKSLVKERDEAGLKKNSTAVHKFLEELVKIDFPGSKAVSEASSKFGPALVSGPVFFVFEKVSTFIVTEEKVEEALPTETKTKEETSGVKERDIVVEEEKKEEEKPQEVVETTTEKIESEAPVTEAKVEEQAAAEAAPAAIQEEKPAAVEQAEPAKA